MKNLRLLMAAGVVAYAVLAIGAVVMTVAWAQDPGVAGSTQEMVVPGSLVLPPGLTEVLPPGHNVVIGPGAGVSGSGTYVSGPLSGPQVYVCTGIVQEQKPEPLTRFFFESEDGRWRLELVREGLNRQWDYDLGSRYEMQMTYLP